MTLLQIIVLALVQGITEFLPISSSAHLILVPVVTGWPDQGLAFDVAVHVGTLAAVLFYFRREVRDLIFGWLQSLSGKHSEAGRLAWYVIIGTIPAGLFGLFLSGRFEAFLRSPLLIAATTIGFGLLLGWADRVNRPERGLPSLKLRDALVVGVAQAFALLPGTSRSGVTITAALFLRLTPQAAARFSFLLSIPIITLAGGVKALELSQLSAAVDWAGLALAAGLSAISAWLCIALFLAAIERIGMLPFVVYRLLLGALLLGVFL